MKKVQKTNYSLNWKILRMTLAKISKIQSDPKNTQKPKIKKIKKSCKGALNHKSLENKL